MGAGEESRRKQRDESKAVTATLGAEGVGMAMGRMKQPGHRHSRKAHEGVTHTNLCFGKWKVQKLGGQGLG